MNRAALANFSRDDLIALILARHEQIAAQAQQISALTVQIAELEAKLAAPHQDAGQFQPATLERPEAQPA